MGKKKKGGSDDLFGDLEDSFFATGEDDTFWDDDTVSAYEESMALPKKELQALAEKAAREEAAREAAAAGLAPPVDPAGDLPAASPAEATPAEAPAPEAPVVAEAAAAAEEAARVEPDAAVAVDAAPQAPQLPPVDLSAATIDLPPPPVAPPTAPAPLADDRPVPVADFFRMAPPPTAPTASVPVPAPAPASAPDRPADSALFSAPTIIMPAGGYEEDDDAPIDAPIDEAEPAPSIDDAATIADGPVNAFLAAPDAGGLEVAETEEAPRSALQSTRTLIPGDGDAFADDADAEAAFFGDSAPARDPEPALDADLGAIAVGGADEADEADVAHQMLGEVLTRSVNDDIEITPAAPRGAQELESVVMDVGYTDGSGEEEALFDASPPADPVPLPDDSTEEFRGAGMLDAPTGEAPLALPRVPALAEPAPLAGADAPQRIRYQAADGDSERWGEAATALEREASITEEAAQRGALLAAAGHIRFRHMGEWEAAESLFGQALQAGSESPGLLRAYADAAASRGDFEQMRTLLERRAQLGSGPAESEALHDVALVERNTLRRPDEAVEVLDRALELDGDDWFALRLLRELRFRDGEWGDLVDVLDRMAGLAWGGEAARLQVERGRILADELDDSATALDAWRSANAADPTSTPAFLALEQGLSSHGLQDELVALYTAEADRLEGPDRAFYRARAARLAAASGAAPAAVGGLFEAAIAEGAGLELRHVHQSWLAGQGDLPGLAASLESEAEALTAPDRALPLYRLALLQQGEMGDSEAALGTLQRVIEADPAAGPAVEAVAQLLDETGRHTDLLAFLEKRLEALSDPNLVVTTLYRMGEICEGPLDDAAQARVWFERILDTATSYLPALEALVRVYTATGAWAELAAIYEQRALLSEDPATVALALHRAGSTYENRLNQTERAAELYQRALDAVADFPPSLDALARLLSAGGQWAALARLLAAAADSCADSNEVVSLRYRAARVFADRVKDHDAAILQLRMCLELSPGFLPALGLFRGLALRGNDWAAAYQLHLQEASATQDMDRRHWRLIAAAQAAQRVEGADATDVIHRILEQDPGHRGALRMLEAQALEHNDHAALIEVYKRVATHLDDDAARASVSARIADVAGVGSDGTTAMQALSDVLASAGERPSRALARLAESFGYWEDAIRSLAVDDPATPAEVARLRETWQEDPAAALDAWRAALVQAPDDLEAASGLERTFSRLGQRDDLADAHATIARSAQHPSVRSVHAVLAAHLFDAADRKGDAEAAYRVAFDARPGRGRAFDALLGMAAGRNDIDAIRALLAEVPGSTEIDLAAALEEAGMATEAAALWVGMLPDEDDVGPEHLTTLVHAERALGAAGDWRGVFDMLAQRRAVTRQPDAREAIDAKRRWVLAEKLADTEEAWDFYRQLHEEAPDDAEVLESLARIAGARGETALAIQYLEGLASVSSDGEAAARYRRRIAEVHLQGDDAESRSLARASYQAALDHHPEDLEALAGLKALAERDEDWRALVGVLAREATVVDGDEQVIRYRAIATTWEVHLKEPGVAMDAWRKVLELRSADPEALQHLIALAREREDWASLVEFAQARLPQIDGAERTALQSELGRVFFKKLYREDEAVRFLDAATSGEHPDPEAAELLERIYAARGQWDLVVEANLSRAQAADGAERVELLLKAAQTRAETLHDRPGAAEIYGMVLDEQPDNAEALRFRGDWLYNSGDLEAAVEIFGRMQESEDQRDFDDFDVRIEVALYYFRFAEALRKLGRAAEALIRFEGGLKLNPSHLPSLEAVGPLYMAEERWSDAGDVYRQILQLTGGQGDPIRLARTYVNLGRVELQQGNLDKAKKRFNKALDLRANDIKALQGIAAVLFARKEWNNLLNVYNNIIYHAQEPAEVVDAYLTKGYVLDARLELPDKAQQHYEKSLAFDPSQPKALLRLAELALRKQDWPEAASLADRGLALDGDDPATLAGLHLVRSVAHVACSDAEAAGSAFEQALAADVTLTDKLGASLPEWARIHEVLRERLQARL